MHPPTFSLAVALLACPFAALAGPEEQLLSVAERSGYTQTASHAQVVELLDALAASSPHARRASMGTTTEGREIPMLILSDPAVSTGAEARELSRATGRPIVLAIGNIHAGEVDGKEALPMVAREMLTGTATDLLKRVIVVVAPIYNADGNERTGKNNRRGQNGPEIVGVRENANGRDLNRDFMKLEEAETRGLVKTLTDFDPHLFIDCHITNGSHHRYVITYGGPRCPGGDAAINDFARDRMFPEIDAWFEKATGLNSFWYGSFEGEFGDANRGHTRWESYPAEPRFGTTYVGLRNRLSVLVESYTYAPYEQRVLATRDFVFATLRWTADNAATVVTLTREADERTVHAGEITTDDDSVALRSRAEARAEKAEVLGFVEVTENGRSRSTGEHATYTVDLMDRFVPTASASRPLMYVIPADPALAHVVERLRLHGIQTETIGHDFIAGIEEYTITGVKPASREFQGHVLVSCEVAASPSTRTIPKGSVLVTTAQPLGNVVVALLEPHAEDSLATWNAFDPWMKLGEKYPVLRVVKRIEGP